MSTTDTNFVKELFEIDDEEIKLVTKHFFLTDESITYINELDENENINVIQKGIQDKAKIFIKDNASKSIISTLAEGLTENVKEGSYFELTEDYNELTTADNAIVKIYKIWHEERRNKLKDVQIAEIQLDPSLFPATCFEYSIVNQKYMIIATEKHFVCHNFTEISEPIILSSTELFDYENLKKERETLYLKPISNEDKFVGYADGTGYIFEITSSLVIKKKFYFVNEPSIYGHLLCYQHKEGDSFVVFNTQTYEEMFKLNIRLNSENTLISPNLNYFLINHEGELKLYKIGNGKLLAKLPVEYIHNLIMNDKFVIFRYSYDCENLHKFKIEDLK